MARHTDTATGYRALMGAPVVVDLVDPSVARGKPGALVEDAVAGLVWAPAPLGDLIDIEGRYPDEGERLTKKSLEGYRKELGMPKAAARDTVFVLLTEGRIGRVELNVATGRGYGVVLEAGEYTISGKRRNGELAGPLSDQWLPFRNRHAVPDSTILEAHAEAADAEALFEVAS